MTTDLIRVAAILAAFALVFAVGVLIQRRMFERPGATVVVVDRRTLRLAERRIPQLIDAGDLLRAHHTAIAAGQWLRGELHTGPRRRRVGYAARLEQLELRDELVTAAIADATS